MPPAQRREWIAAARERAGYSQAGLAEKLDVSSKAIWRWESGTCTPKPEVRAALAAALNMDVGDVNDHLGVAPAPVPSNAGGSAQFPSVAGWLPFFVRAEQSANGIWAVNVTVLHALCQTSGYAEAVQRSGWLELSDEQIDQLVEQRLQRAAVLDQASYSALIAEPLLHAVQGSDQIMAEQLAHLLDLADRPNVTLQIIDVEHLAATPGEFTLLDTGGYGPDVATEIGVNGQRSAEGPEAAAKHIRLFDHLQALARSPEASRTAIARAADRFAARASKLKGPTPR